MASGPPYRIDNRLEAAPECRDCRVYYSAPDSLRLNANLGETAYYRFPDRAVKGGSKYRLQFRYLVARGSVGTCSVKVHQYEDNVRSWRALEAGTLEGALPVVGRWQSVTVDFVTQAAATSAAVTFRVESPCEVGEMWVDDCSLRPAGEPVTEGP